ncbi:type IIL restriction-modification enzyme MmeI [Sphingomonas sp. MMS24-JH45]
MDADEFIAKWQVSGGNERANTQLFVTDLCDLLGVERPQPTQSETGRNDYVFERHVVKPRSTVPPPTAGSTSTSATASSWKPSRAARPT